VEAFEEAEEVVYGVWLMGYSIWHINNGLWLLDNKVGS
jgi:hypothetical protein